MARIGNRKGWAALVLAAGLLWTAGCSWNSGTGQAAPPGGKGQAALPVSAGELRENDRYVIQDGEVYYLHGSQHLDLGVVWVPEA